MADGKIEIDTEINTQKANKDLTTLSGSIKKFAKGGALIAGITTAFKATAKAIKETTDAYNVQAKAEKQLEVAAQNNPYLDTTSVKQLKNYASQLQSISTVGDEELLPLMAQLAAAGRTQTEIQSIMSAALDVSASGAMSLEGAVKNLNKSFSGMAGELGESVPAIKNLTTEELKSGKAVEVLAAQYKGMAEETTKATGSTQQLQNAWGDLKEEIGKPVETGVLAPFRRGLTTLINTTIEGILKLKQAIAVAKGEEADGKKISKEIIKDANKSFKDINKRQEEIRRQANMLSEAEQDATLKYINGLSTLSREQLTLQEQLRKNHNERIAQENAEREALLLKMETEEEEAKARKKAQEKAANAEKTRQDIIDAYKKSEADRLEQKRLENELTGQEFDNMEELNDKMAAYVDLVMELEDGENDPFAKKKRDEILKYAEYVGKLGATFNETEEAVEEFKVSIDEVLADLKEYFSEFNDITQQSVELARMSNEEETKKAQGELAKQYNDGLISYEEYNEKKKEIDKKTAREEYKLKMWEWSSSLLTATANIAEGVSKAIAQGGIAGIITGALVAASGSLQLATITANKPMAPSFATGGIVQGTSYTGDNVRANVNSGEMILNANQQANLWRLANGRSGGGSNINMPITIENKNGSSVRTQFNKNGLRVIVDDMVNASMQRGSYTQSMNIANSRQNGGRIL